MLFFLELHELEEFQRQCDEEAKWAQEQQRLAQEKQRLAMKKVAEKREELKRKFGSK